MTVFLGPAQIEAKESAGAAASLVTLEELRQVALDHNPEIIAAHADWMAATRQVWIDSSLPDPMVGMDVMGADVETRVGPQMNRLMVSQEIPFPVKLIEKGKAANAEAAAAKSRYLAVQRDVLNELAKAYYELYFIDASLQVIEETKGLLEQFEGVARSRYANLAGSQRDAAKAQAEFSLVLEKLFMLSQRRQSVAAVIQALLNRDPMETLGEAQKPQKPTLKISVMEAVNWAVQNRQEIKEMESLVSKSRHESRLAKLEWIPDLNLGFEYTWVGDAMTADPDDGKNSWMFPLRINLPIWWNRNIPEVQKANQELKANEARFLKAKNTAYSEVKDAYYRYDSAIKITELYETALLPQAKLALSSDQAGYESGSVDFLNLLDSERVYLSSRLSYIQFFTESLKSYADLLRATGLDLNDLKEENLAESEEEKK